MEVNQTNYQPLLSATSALTKQILLFVNDELSRLDQPDTNKPDMKEVADLLSFGRSLCLRIDRIQNMSASKESHISADINNSDNEKSTTFVNSTIYEGLIGKFSRNGNNVINIGNGWSYRISRENFNRIVRVIAARAGQGEFFLKEITQETGVKESHVYRTYVLLYRARLLNQQHNSRYLITPEQAERLDPDQIWPHIPTS